ncbi:SEC-C metal-binding domain-containing protein [Aurantimonas sp. A2-1-M11]|uniref:SEC-C metal-binding domain-containing protein n=1 Tax=Aurantimonas sp. A2-1-M11 TaxID=3113712 RepID=UPI003FA55160
MSEDETNAFDDTGPVLIPRWVLALNAWRLANATSALAPLPTFGKVGRNDPCPCGSGKKYKNAAASIDLNVTGRLRSFRHSS